MYALQNVQINVLLAYIKQCVNNDQDNKLNLDGKVFWCSFTGFLSDVIDVKSGS